MEKKLKILIVSVIILLIVSIWALFINDSDKKKNTVSNEEPVAEEPEREAREVVYLIFPASQNTTQLQITEVTKTPDSDNLLASGIEEDFRNPEPDNNQGQSQNIQDNDPGQTNPNDKPDVTDPDEGNPDDKPDEGNPDDKPDNQDPGDKPDEQNPDNPDNPDTPEPGPEPTPTPEPEPTPPPQPGPDPNTGAPIAAMYLKYASSSSGNLDYILYVPANANANTPIFIFLHGNGEVGKDMEVALTRYAFLEDLKNGSWQPGCIIICPIAKKKSHWKAEVNNLNFIIDEVTTNYGGSRSNMYLSGASAGADAMTKIAEQIPFQGAIYMAGHMNGNGIYSVDAFLNVWAGKKVYYYRDNLAGGGYGYSKAFVDGCIAKAPSYGVTFEATDLNWNHTVGLVDATFLPSAFIDKNGRNCKNGLAKVVYGQ